MGKYKLYLSGDPEYKGVYRDPYTGKPKIFNTKKEAKEMFEQLGGLGFNLKYEIKEVKK